MAIVDRITLIVFLFLLVAIPPKLFLVIIGAITYLLLQ